MPPETKSDAPATAPPPRGVPLGGVGAGSIEFGRDGRFRNITINNNRTRGTAIPLAAHSFAAVHVSHAGRTYPLVLQQARDDGAGAGEAPRIDGGKCHWQGTYPTSHFQLRDKSYPAQVVMSAFAPVIPYDQDASSMPVLCVSVRLGNRTAEPMDISVLFNMENLCGRTADSAPQRCPPAAPLVVEEHESRKEDRQTEPKQSRKGRWALGRTTRPGGKGPLAQLDAEEEQEAPPPRFNAIEFGSPSAQPSNAHGHYCLAVRRRPSFAIDTLVWDPEHPDDHTAFWNGFRREGIWPKGFTSAGETRAGALCCRFQLGPRYEQRVDFVFAWHCPRFEVQGVDLGNGYANRFKDAAQVARQAMRHHRYYIQSVEDWLARVMSASLPHWLTRMLANSCQVFSANTLHTRRGVFAMMESADHPVAERLDRRLYWSLGTLLFFPRFEHAALRQLATATSSQNPDWLCRSGRMLDPEAHDFENAGPMQTELCAQFVLSAYRNYRFSGNLAHAQALFPRMRRAMAAVAAQDQDGDGLPEPPGELAVYDGLRGAGLHSPAASMWVAALAAYSRMAEALDQQAEAMRAKRMQARAAAAFEARYWCASGFYRLFPAAPGQHTPAGGPVCHSAQLMGEWYAGLLGLAPLFDPAHTARALSAVLENNTRHGTLASASQPEAGPDNSLPEGAALAWPTLALAHFACPLIYYGRVSEALALVKHAAGEERHGSRFRFDTFLKHLPETLAPAPDNLHGHAYPLSVWYIYYALLGFELSAAERRLRITPHLPEGVNIISAPLFTTSCLGWLKYKEPTRENYEQHVELSFDSPLPVETLELRVPETVQAVTVNCEHPDDEVRSTHSLRPALLGKRLMITLEKEVIITGHFKVTIAAAPAPEMEADTSVPSTE